MFIAKPKRPRIDAQYIAVKRVCHKPGFTIYEALVHFIPSDKGNCVAVTPETTFSRKLTEMIN